MEDNLHMVIFLTPPRYKDHVLSVVRYIQKQTSRSCRHGLQKYLKNRTGLLKMGGSRVSKTWRWECYWELGYGYVPYKEVSELLPEVKKWLCEPIILGGPMGRDDYMRVIAEEVETFMQEEWKAPRDPPSMEDWIKTGTWMQGKSGTEEVGRVTIDGKTVRTGRMKSVMGAIMKDSDVERDLLRVVRERMCILQKSEGAKIRAVAKTGNAINRKMNYLSEYLEKGLMGSKLSTLFAGSAGNEKIDNDLIKAARNEYLWKVPLDQGGFDQHQSKDVIATVLWVIGKNMIKKCPQIEGVWTALWDSLFVEGASVECGDWLGEWENGLPSGWRWTAVLDTILNITSFRAVKRVALARLARRAGQIWHFYAQGDDVIFACDDLGLIQAIISVYGDVGYEVHPLKTYISRCRGEFLRRSFETIGVTGYLARSLVSLRFRSPIQANPITRGERLYGNLIMWHLASLRGADPEACANMFLSNAEDTWLKREEVAAFVLTPSSVGGCGLSVRSPMGSWFHRHSNKKWYAMEVTRQKRRISVNLGTWTTRFEQLGWEMDEITYEQFQRDLCFSWGLRESQVWGCAYSKLVEVPRITPLPIPQIQVDLPRADEIWEVEKVPVQVRGMLKRQCLRLNTGFSWMKREYHGLVAKLKKMTSIRIWMGYLTGEWTCPVPLVGTVGPSYGSAIKKWADRMILKAIGSGVDNFRDFERNMLWIEKKVETSLTELGVHALMAQ